MQQQEIPVVFQPQGKRVFVLPGTNLLEAATRAGLTLTAPCGGRGTCGKCRIRIVQGAEHLEPPAPGPLGPEELAAGLRLACVTRVTAPLVVDIPATTLADGVFQALGSDTETTFAVEDAPVRKTFVEVPTPSLEDPRADTERLRGKLGRLTIPLDRARALPAALAAENGAGTAVVAEDRLLTFEPGDTTHAHLAAAFDIGTTTIAGSLLDLAAGVELASLTRMNPQTAYGDDVLARISHVSSCATCLGDLQQMVTDAMNEMMGEMASRAGRRVGEILDVTLAGNTTMQHLLAGVSPASLGQVPFAPVFTDAVEADAARLGLRIHPAGRFFLFPAIGGFVGGDTVACLVATELHRQEGAVLLVDVGTNGEIVLVHNGALKACSTAAGPAFEGARIRHGMRAHNGAIEKVLVRDGDLHWNVIGNTPPVGLCGSALLDVAAELRRLGFLEETGRLLEANELPEDAPLALRERLVESEDGTEYVVARAGETRTGEPITLTQKDLREMQLAVAAIRAGINILLAEAGLEAGDLSRLLLAGGFGNYIRRSNAQAVGLLPLDMDRHRIQFIGNASLTGAKRAAVSRAARQTAIAVATQTLHVDLSQHLEFQNEYAMAMFLPEVPAAEPAASDSRRLRSADAC